MRAGGARSAVVSALGAEAGAELAAILARLAAALARRFGAAARIENPSVATLGGSNRTLLFDFVDGAARRPLVLRQETFTLPHSPFLAPEPQWHILELVHAHGVPVPEPVFLLEPADGLGRGYVVGRVDGETLPKRLLHAPEFARARAVFVEQAAAILARLHGIDAAAAAVVAGVPESGDPLEAQRLHYHAYGEPHPVVDYALRWLQRERPAAARRVLLHGDFRNGNMVVDQDGIRALLDWECAHLGDPAEDLAWFCTRAWRFGLYHNQAGGFAPREDFLSAYERASGQAVDRRAVRWWEIYGLLRWALYNVMQVYGHRGGRRSPAYAACGRNTSFIEYDLLMTISGKLD